MPLKMKGEPLCNWRESSSSSSFTSPGLSLLLLVRQSPSSSPLSTPPSLHTPGCSLHIHCCCLPVGDLPRLPTFIETPKSDSLRLPTQSQTCHKPRHQDSNEISSTIPLFTSHVSQHTTYSHLPGSRSTIPQIATY